MIIFQILFELFDYKFQINKKKEKGKFLIQFARRLEEDLSNEH